MLLAKNKPTAQANLRCGTVAILFAQYPDVGEFCIQGNLAGELHAWRLDGRWALDGAEHPWDIISTRPLK